MYDESQLSALLSQLSSSSSPSQVASQTHHTKMIIIKNSGLQVIKTPSSRSHTLLINPLPPFFFSSSSSSFTKVLASPNTHDMKEDSYFISDCLKVINGNTFLEILELAHKLLLHKVGGSQEWAFLSFSFPLFKRQKVQSRNPMVL
jgi:hypothetical protein